MLPKDASLASLEVLPERDPPEPIGLPMFSFL